MLTRLDVELLITPGHGRNESQREDSPGDVSVVTQVVTPCLLVRRRVDIAFGDRPQRQGEKDDEGERPVLSDELDPLCAAIVHSHPPLIDSTKNCDMPSSYHVCSHSISAISMAP